MMIFQILIYLILMKNILNAIIYSGLDDWLKC